VTRAWTSAAVPALVALYVLSVLSTVRPLVDRDIWWHLRTGEWIRDHHAAPRVDPFVVAPAATAWRAASWLFDVALDALYRAAGFRAFAVYTLVLGGAILLALQWLTTRSIARPYTGIALPGLAFAALAPLLVPRPDLLSVLLFTVELAVLLSALESGRAGRLWLLPPLLALWANLHAEFVYGLLVLGLATVAQLVDRRLAPGGAAHEPSLPLALVTVTAGLATLLTPYHTGLYSTVLAQGRRTAADDVFSDLLSLQFRQPADWIVLALGLGAAASAGARARHRTFMTMLLAVSAYVSFRSSRDVWMLVVSAAAVLSAPAPTAGPVPPPMRWIGGRAVIGIVLATGALLALGLWSTLPSRARWEADVASRFPAAAATVIEELRLGGPIYAPIEWGGYLLWRLPQRPVAIDGRMDLHGVERVARSLVTWAGGRDWASDRELLAAATVVAPAESPLAELLRDGRRFDVIYNDRVAVLFAARRAANGAEQLARETP
jgi:hypothetical protein